MDMHAFQHGYSILCLDAENAYHAEEDEEVHCWPPKEWVKRYHARGGRVENPWWKLETALRETWKAAKKFNDFVVSATVGLFGRPGTTLIFELHLDDFYVSRSNVELAWLQGHLGARLKLKPAETRGSGSQYRYLRATRTRVDVDTIHIAPREMYIKNVQDIFCLSDNKCKSMPTPIIPTRQKSDEDEPRLGEEDRRGYHRCVGIHRHPLKCRPDIAIAAHEVSKTLTRRRRPPKIATTNIADSEVSGLADPSRHGIRQW